MKPVDLSAAFATATAAPSTPGKNDQAAQEHLYKLNPDPQHAYEVVLTIQDAPGPFKVTRWSAGYKATGCTYIVNDWAGVRGFPEHRVTLPFTQRPDGSYVATVFLDAMLDEDYYGNGVCEWTLTGVGASGSPTGAPDEATFGGQVGLKNLLAEEPQAMFYWSRDYGAMAPTSNDKHHTVSKEAFGSPARETFKAELQNSLFSWVLTPKKEEP